MFCITCTYINRLIMVLGSTTCHHSLCSRYYSDWEETRSVEKEYNETCQDRCDTWALNLWHNVGNFVMHAACFEGVLFPYKLFHSNVTITKCNDYQSSRLWMELSPKSKDCYWLVENQASNFNWSELTWILKKFIVYGRNYQNTFLP